MCLLTLGFGQAIPQERVYDEYAIKAAYVYNLSKFVEWPAPETAGDFEICIYGRDPYGARIDAVSTRTRRGLPIAVVRHDRLVESACAIAFIGESETYRIEEAIRFFNARPVLTIGETSEFVDRGGMVGLVAAQDRVTFEINLDTVRAAQLEFSSQLLRIASRLVETRARP